MWSEKRVNHLPEATGTFTPGCMDVMFDYTKDGIFMRLYYPTTERKDNPKNFYRWLRWIPDDNYIAGLAKVLLSFTFVVRLAIWWSSGVVPVLYGAKPKLDQKLKCIVVSHGLGGFRSLYSNICCELASRGFLVAVLEHRDGSACYTYYYKSKDEAKNKIRTDVNYEPFALGKNHFAQRKRQITARAKECCKAVDFLVNLNNGLIPHNIVDDVPTNKLIDFKLADLAGKLDVDNLTIMGHSFGGGTSLLTLSQKPELKQGILLDPWMYPIKDDNLEEKIDQPLLFINTQTFHIVSNVQSMSKFLENERKSTMYTVLHSTHEHQTDTVLLVGSWLNWFMKKIDPLVALKINNALILEFLHKHVGSPENVDDVRQYLDDQKINLEAGLTKPWA